MGSITPIQVRYQPDIYYSLCSVIENDNINTFSPVASQRALHDYQIGCLSIQLFGLIARFHRQSLHLTPDH